MSLRRFRYIFLRFGIYHWRRLTFGRENFSVGSTIKSSCGIYTTHDLCFTITDQGGRNIAAWK